MKHIEARLPNQTVSTVFVVLMDIRSVAVAKTIVDTKIYEKSSDYFVEHVWEVCNSISQKQVTYSCATEAPSSNSPNKEHYQGVVAKYFESDDYDIMETTLHDKEDDSLARESDNCTLQIKAPVD